MEPLRLLHVTPYYHDAWAYGGIPRLASALARGLAARGHRVTVCTTDACDARRRLPRGTAPGADPPGASSGDRSPVDLRVFPNLSNRLAYHYQAFCPIGLRAFLRRHAGAFDAAHIHAHRHLLEVLAVRALARAGVPYVVQPNGTAPRLERRRTFKSLFDALLGRRLLPDAARVVAVSDAERRQLLALGVPAERLAVVPNPIDLGEFDDLPPRGRFRRRWSLDGGPLVVYLGKLTPRKRLDVLVDAFARLGHAGARLVVAGNDMGVARSLRRRIRAHGLGRQVRFTGLLTGPRRLEALVDADVFVYPSEHEVFGLAAFEALLCGTPVVVAGDSGCGEYVAQVGGGLVVRPGDPDATAEALAEVLSDLPAWTAAARSAAERVRAAFSASAVAGHLEALYRRLDGCGARSAHPLGHGTA